MDRWVIGGSFDTVFELDYSVQTEDMRSLYEKAKRDQWNASRDIAWDTPGSDDGRVLADELIDLHGSPLWERLGQAERVELNRRVTAWRLSILVYGEQGAMLACSQLVDIVSGADQKFFQATQVMDEARHNEVLERYIETRLGGVHYPMPENERFIFDAILTDPRWYIKTIALQLIAETFAVSMFRMMGQAAMRRFSSTRSFSPSRSQRGDPWMSISSSARTRPSSVPGVSHAMSRVAFHWSRLAFS